MVRKIPLMAIAIIVAVLIWTGCDVLSGGMTTSTPTTSPSATGATGIAQWVRTVSAGTSNSVFAAVAKDSSGNVYAAGAINDTDPYNFGNSVTAAGTGAQNTILVKYDASGTAQWAKTVSSGTVASVFIAVTTDSSGNVYAAGYIYTTGTYDFSNGVTAAGTCNNLNVLLVKYNATGTAQWAKTVAPGDDDSYFSSVTTDGSGNVYVTGYITGTDPYGFGNSVTATGSSLGYSPVIVKYNASGTAQWAQTLSSGSADSQFNGVTTDSSGNVYAAGYISGTGAYGFGNSVTATGTSGDGNVVLVKYNASGTAQWARTLSSGSADSQFKAVTTDSSGYVYASGYITGTDAFGFGYGVAGTGTSGDGNVVLVKYNASGTAQWAKTLSSGSGSSLFNAVTTDSSGNVYAAGYVNDTVTYDFGNSVTATGVSDSNIVLVKYNASGTAQWAKTVASGSDDSQFYGVTTDSSGKVYAAGYISDTVTYDFGNSVTAAGTSGGYNPVIVKYE